MHKLVAAASTLALLVGALLMVPLLLGGTAAGDCLPATVGALQGGKVVAASIYGGPADSTSGTRGYRGDHLPGKAAFAELSTNWQAPSGWDFAALGDRPHAAALRITATVDGRTRSVVARKLDIGRGGPDVQGHPRAIDLWWETANALGLPGTSGAWTGLVHIEAADSRDTTTELFDACAALIASGPLAQRIVRVARAELAKNISEPGNNCVAYNNCNGQPWCAAFVSHVWKTAGVPMPFTEASNQIWVWASQYGHVLGPTEQPQPGDAILYGTGPADTNTSVHVGIVETVQTDGRITTIEGSLSDRVKRNGPFLPADAVAAGEPGPVYAYARPV